MSRRKTPTWPEIHEMFAEVARQQKETARKSQETDRQLQETGRRIGELTNGWGHFVESLVMPGVGPALTRHGYEMDGVTGPTKKRRGADTYEVDTIALGCDRDGRPIVVAVEIRSHLDAGSVAEWVDKLGAFFDWFPEYDDRDLIGMVAGIRIDEAVPDHAIRAGLFAMVPSGETVVLANSRGFRPRVWPAIRERR